MTLVRKDRTYRGKPTHSYELDGVKVPGVTTLLSKGLPKPALPPWAAKSVAEYVADNPDQVRSMLDSMGRESIVGALKGVPWDKRDEAAARGSEIHALAERIVMGEEVELPEHLVGYVQGYVDFVDAWAITAHHAEVSVARRPRDGVPGYAGTFDADVTIGAGPLAGRRGLVDWKTSRGVYGEAGLQLAAYANADFMLVDGAEVAIPEYDFLGIVHVTPTGADLYVVEDPAACWRIFRHVAYVAEQIAVIEKQIASPIPSPQITQGDAA